MVIHAHYLKEDMIFCCALLFAIFSLILFIEDLGAENKFLFILLGIATGLTISAKYVGALFFCHLSYPLGHWHPKKKSRIQKNLFFLLHLCFCFFCHQLSIDF